MSDTDRDSQISRRLEATLTTAGMTQLEGLQDGLDFSDSKKGPVPAASGKPSETLPWHTRNHVIHRTAETTAIFCRDTDICAVFEFENDKVCFLLIFLPPSVEPGKRKEIDDTLAIITDTNRQLSE